MLCQRCAPRKNVCYSNKIVHKTETLSSIEKKKYVFPDGSKLGLNNTTDNEQVSLGKKLISEGSSIFKSVDFSELKNAPFPAIVYGFGGIIPFVTPPLYFIIGAFSPFLATSQLMYGATILAFIGGVKWGNAVAKNDESHTQIGLSILPSLIAWSSLLVPEPVGLLVVSSGLVGALYIDYKSSGYPPWFFAMRATLTGIAVTSLFATLGFYLFNLI